MRIFLAILAVLAVLAILASAIEVYTHHEKAKQWEQRKWVLMRQEVYGEVRALDSERHYYLNEKPDPWTGMKMSLYVSINHARKYVELALIRCNLSERRDAVEAMQQAIDLINSDNRLRGNNAAERAEKFRDRIRDSSSGYTFKEEEMFRFGEFILAVPLANWNNSIQAEINTANAIAAYCDSIGRTYQYETDRISRKALREADFEYHQKTGHDYDSRRRPSGGEARKEWEYCHKIHEIFE